MRDPIDDAVSVAAGFALLAMLAGWFMVLPTIGLLYVTGFLIR